MPSYARKHIVDETQIGVYQCIGRCVRRAFLCGTDAVSGRDFSHRKVWLQGRLESLASLFAVEICTFSVMSNHFHVVLRIRPDIAAAWSDEEVAYRWASVRAIYRKHRRTMPEPNRAHIDELLNSPKELADCRKRLSSLSMFMALLCEPLAILANKEDRVSGRFWQGRFRSQALLDESAMLACSMYVDLNPIRAGVAATPEQSAFTSAFTRIKGLEARSRRAKRREMRQAKRRKPASITKGQRILSVLDRPADAWLCEFQLDERPGKSPLMTKAIGKAPTPQPKGSEAAASAPAIELGPRASDRGFLPLTIQKYLSLLDWTGREIREGKTGSIPRNLKPILERLNVDPEALVDLIANFGRWFKGAVGKVESLDAEAKKTNRRWYHGRTRAAAVFL